MSPPGKENATRQGGALKLSTNDNSKLVDSTREGKPRGEARQ